LQRYRETKQVEIETRFVEINTGNLDEFAIQWGFQKGPTSRSNTWSLGSKGASNQNSIPDIRTLAEAFATPRSSMGQGKIVSTDNNGVVHNSTIDNSPPSFPNLANFGNNANPLGDFIGVISGGKLNIMLKALEQSTEAEMMCAPKITVLSGKMASITVAQELRYPTSYSETKSDVGSSSDNNSGAGVTITAGRPENFQTRNVGVEMSVIPTVEENGCIDLQLQPTVTEFEGFVEYGGTSVAMNNARTVYTPSGFYQPIFSTRQIRTELTIQNGSTVIMGGLMREESKELKDKIPILGDLPILGKLFRSRGETTQKKNLLIFVTANILSSDGVPLKAPHAEIFSSQEEQNIFPSELSPTDENRPSYAKTKMSKRHHRY
jgi:general secretion pathway protein D